MYLQSTCGQRAQAISAVTSVREATWDSDASHKGTGKMVLQEKSYTVYDMHGAFTHPINEPLHRSRTEGFDVRGRGGGGRNTQSNYETSASTEL